MTVNEMREKLKKAYSSPNWEEKVDRMKDKQVIALYYKFLNEKKI